MSICATVITCRVSAVAGFVRIRYTGRLANKAAKKDREPDVKVDAAFRIRPKQAATKTGLRQSLPGTESAAHNTEAHPFAFGPGEGAARRVRPSVRRAANSRVCTAQTTTRAAASDFTPDRATKNGST